MTQNTDLAVREDAGEVTTDLDTLIASAQDLTITDPAEISAQIINRILSSESVDDVFALIGTTPAQDLLGVPLIVQSARVMKSAIEDGLQIYMLIEAVSTTTGEALTITCGAGNVMGQLERLRQLGALPIGCSIEQQAKATANGYHPMYLKDQRAFVAALKAPDAAGV